MAVATNTNNHVDTNVHIIKPNGEGYFSLLRDTVGLEEENLST